MPLSKRKLQTCSQILDATIDACIRNVILPHLKTLSGTKIYRQTIIFNKLFFIPLQGCTFTVYKSLIAPHFFYIFQLSLK